MKNVIKSERKGCYLQQLLKLLKKNRNGVPRLIAMDLLAEEIGLTYYEREIYQSGGRRFDKMLETESVYAVSAGWIKKNRGIWSITEDGIIALKEIKEIENLHKVVLSSYKKRKNRYLGDNNIEVVSHDLAYDNNKPIFSAAKFKAAAKKRKHKPIELEEIKDLKIYNSLYKLKADVGDDKKTSDDEVELTKDPRNIPVWFSTNRLPVNKGNIPTGFSDKWTEEVTLGKCLVNVPEGHVPGELGSSWWIRLIKGDDSLRVLSVNPIPDTDYWTALGKAMQVESDKKKNNEALFFLHGYNMSFEEAALRTAQLSYDLRIQPAIFFSWPSGGGKSDYNADEETIQASYDAVTNFVSKLDKCAFETGTTLHVMAHSMGNRALLKALEVISSGITDGNDSAIDKLVFAAPDVDIRHFMQSFEKIKPVGKNKTLYVSRKDKAVWFSKVLHKFPRAGLIPPVTIAEGLDTIDATDVDSTFWGHSYIATVRALITDLSMLLKASMPVADRVGLEQVISKDGEQYWKIK